MEHYIMEKVMRNKDIFDNNEWYFIQNNQMLINKLYQIYMLEDFNKILRIPEGNPV